MLRQVCLFVLCLAFTTTAQGQSIIDAIGGVPELSNLTDYISRFPAFVSWLEEQENITLLAPSNEAFSELDDPAVVTVLPDDETAAQALLRYHVLDGIHSTFGPGDLQLIPTALQPGEYANVTGGQIVVAQGSRWSTQATIWSGLLTSSQTTGDHLNVTAGVVHMIDSFLTLPQPFTWTTEGLGILGAVAFANAELGSPDSAHQTTVDHLSDVTIFLPMNYSLQEVGNVLQNMSKTELDRVLSYHIVDQILDIDLDAPPNATYSTLEGTEVSIFAANDYAFINNARIVGKANWLFSGGIIYTIYGVLNPDNTTIDPDINDAEIAYQGATFTPDLAFPAPAPEPGTEPDSGSDSSDSNSTTNTTAATTSSSSSGLSTGAKAGISTGAAVGCLLLIGATVAGIFLYRSRRRRHKSISGTRKPYPLRELTTSQKNLTSEISLVSREPMPGRY